MTLHPFDPRTTRIAERYLNLLSSILCDHRVELQHRGSTAFHIAGKRDIEIGIFPSEDEWENVIGKLSQHFGPPNHSEEDFIRFNNDESGGYDIEIILLKGYLAKIDRCLTAYLLESPDLLKKYEEVKRKYAHSKREYMKAKEAFFRSVIQMIPEEPNV